MGRVKFGCVILYHLNAKFRDGSKKVVKVEDGISTPITLDPAAYTYFRIWTDYLDRTAVHSITLLFGSSKGSRVTLGETENGLWKDWSKGYAAHFVFDPPEELTEYTSQSGVRVMAKIKSEVDSIQKGIAFDEKGVAPHEELRIFSGTPIQTEITWEIFRGDTLVKAVMEKPLIPVVEDGLQHFRTFGNRTFYPMVKSMPASLAPAWGFIDSKYALLALEQDTLPAAMASEYAKAGVPGLNAEDIYTEEGDLDSLPISAWLMQKNHVLEDILKPTSVKAKPCCVFPQARMYGASR